jgi:hypothetical protein
MIWLFSIGRLSKHYEVVNRGEVDIYNIKLEFPKETWYYREA